MAASNAAVRRPRWQWESIAKPSNRPNDLNIGCVTSMSVDCALHVRRTRGGIVRCIDREAILSCYARGVRLAHRRGSVWPMALTSSELPGTAPRCLSIVSLSPASVQSHRVWRRSSMCGVTSPKPRCSARRILMPLRHRRDYRSSNPRASGGRRAGGM